MKLLSVSILLIFSLAGLDVNAGPLCFRSILPEMLSQNKTSSFKSFNEMIEWVERESLLPFTSISFRKKKIAFQFFKAHKFSEENFYFLVSLLVKALGLDLDYKKFHIESRDIFANRRQLVAEVYQLLSTNKEELEWRWGQRNQLLIYGSHLLKLPIRFVFGRKLHHYITYPKQWVQSEESRQHSSKEPDYLRTAWKVQKLASLSFIVYFSYLGVKEVDSSVYPVKSLWTSKNEAVELMKPILRSQFSEKFGRPMTKEEEHSFFDFSDQSVAQILMEVRRNHKE